MINDLKENSDKQMNGVRKSIQDMVKKVSNMTSSARKLRYRKKNRKVVTHRLLQRHLHTHVYCNTVHNSQVMETAKMPHH
jgi:hypothetical protein